MVKQLSPEEALQFITTSAPVIIDVRDEESYARSKIDTAIQLSLVDMKLFCQTTPKNKPVLVYCYHGISSQAVAQHLIDQGFKEVYSLAGGFEKWHANRNNAIN